MLARGTAQDQLKTLLIIIKTACYYSSNIDGDYTIFMQQTFLILLRLNDDDDNNTCSRMVVTNSYYDSFTLTH